MQGTGGRSSVRVSGDPMRKAGAAGRDMPLEAASMEWKVDKSTCRTENGIIYHDASKRNVTYGTVAKAASKLPVPQDVPLKDPKKYRIIGKPTKRLDTPDKDDGRAQFGIDARQPAMLYAVVARCLVFRGKVASVDATKANAFPGDKIVEEI